MSTDALRNPAGPVRTVGTAFIDLVHVPYQAPEFGPAILASTANFGGRTLCALADSSGRFIGHIANGSLCLPTKLTEWIAGVGR